MDSIAIEDALTRVELLPGLGAKIISLFDKRRQHEWLWRTPDRGFRAPGYGDTFEDYDLSGYDDCFPTVAECPYPSPPWEGAVAPDHGELWALPWDCRRDGDGLVCACEGRRFPYRFERRVSLLPTGGARLDFHVRNHSSSALNCVWSAHPLLAIPPGARLVVPDDAGAAEIVLDWSLDDRLGPIGTWHRFPVTADTEGAAFDISLAPPRDERRAYKLFSRRLRRGQCAVADPVAAAALVARWPADVVPYLGLWLNYNGIPDESPHYNLAPEPCTAPTERLDAAIVRGECTTVPPNGEVDWWLSLAFAEATT